jgi:hypothetical protein
MVSPFDRRHRTGLERAGWMKAYAGAAAAQPLPPVPLFGGRSMRIEANRIVERLSVEIRQIWRLTSEMAASGIQLMGQLIQLKL